MIKGDFGEIFAGAKPFSKADKRPLAFTDMEMLQYSAAGCGISVAVLVSPVDDSTRRRK